MCRIFAYSEQQNEATAAVEKYSSLMHIEHFVPQSDIAFGVAKSLDYDNMLAVCDGGVWYNMDMNLIGGQNLSCDVSKGDKLLSLNPAVRGDAQRMRIRYTSSCKIKSDNEQFDKEINNILNLNVKRLVNLRKSAKQVIIKALREGKIQAKNKKAIISSLQLAKTRWSSPPAPLSLGDLAYFDCIAYVFHGEMLTIGQGI